MSEMPPGLPRHPIGTLAFVAIYAGCLVVGWFVIYWALYLARQPVTP